MSFEIQKVFMPIGIPEPIEIEAKHAPRSFFLEWARPRVPYSGWFGMVWGALGWSGVAGLGWFGVVWGWLGVVWGGLGCFEVAWGG